MIDESSYAYRLGMAEQEVKRLREALAGLVGLTELVSARNDLPPSVREALTANHRILEARRVLADAIYTR